MPARVGIWTAGGFTTRRQFENALLLNKYFLLYEELSYAMNSGDIGRIETYDELLVQCAFCPPAGVLSAITFS